MTALDEIILAVDLLGVLANGLLGGAIARVERLDPVGFVVLALVSALGGGLLRDVLLQAHPPAALGNEWYLIVAVVAAVIAYLLRFEGRWWNRTFPVLDGLALGCWAAVGAQKTLLYGLGWMPAILLGTVTAVGGGMIRDLLVGRRPAIFGGNTLYATCAVVASVVAVIAHFVLPFDAVGVLIATVVGMTLVLVARHRDWRLPEESATAFYERRRRRRRARRSQGQG